MDLCLLLVFFANRIHTNPFTIHSHPIVWVYRDVIGSGSKLRGSTFRPRPCAYPPPPGTLSGPARPTARDPPCALRALAALRVLLVLVFLRVIAIGRVLLLGSCSAGMCVLRGPVVLLRDAADAHSLDSGAMLPCMVEAPSVTGVYKRVAQSSCDGGTSAGRTTTAFLRGSLSRSCTCVFEP